MELLLATGNVHKATAIQSILGQPVRHVKLDLPKVQSIDVQVVIEEKARVAYQLLGKPVIVEDTSLSFVAWNGLPGALIRWFLESVGNEGLCQMLSTYDQRDAKAETCLGFYDGQKLMSFSGVVHGLVPQHPRGQGGFGWDPIFVPDGWSKSFAEMSKAEAKRFVSMRTIAALKLKAYLDEQNM